MPPEPARPHAGSTTMNITSKPPRRILVVDDHPIVRLGVRQMIATEADLSVCCEADTAEAALQAIRRDQCDLAIVDLSLGTVSGLELIRQLHEAAPALPVLVLSMHDEALFAERALRAGARGYIMKKEAIGGLIGAVRQILAGKVYVSEQVSQRLLGQLGGDVSAPVGRLGGLTDRELEVFELVGRGLSTADIAKRLGVSAKTIETYRSNIKTKLKLKDAKELLRYATSWTERL